ncbi:MAG: hypothetical protein WCJ25_05375 [Candidatus Moraniibacteriota bacterium]
MTIFLAFISGIFVSGIMLYLFNIGRTISETKKVLENVPGAFTSNDLLSLYRRLKTILRIIPESLRYHPPFRAIVHLGNRIIDWHRVLLAREMESGIITVVATAGSLLEATAAWYSLLSKELAFDDQRAYEMWEYERARRIPTLSFVTMHLIDWYDYHLNDLERQSAYWTGIKEMIGESLEGSVLSEIDKRQLAGAKVIESANRLKDILKSGTEAPHENAILPSLKELSRASKHAYDLASQNQKTLGQE